MVYKVLIIDDNHSFIDTLKVNLAQFPFNFDSAFQFHLARNKLKENKTFINRTVEPLIVDYFRKSGQIAPERKKAAADEVKEIPTVPEIQEGPLRESGYLFVVIEQNTERNVKGLQFIEEMLRSESDFRAEDFILLSSSPAEIQGAAEKLGVTVMEKPPRTALLHSLLEQKIASVFQYRELLEKNLENLSLESAFAVKPKAVSAAPAKKRTRKTTTSTKTKTSAPAQSAKKTSTTTSTSRTAKKTSRTTKTNKS